MSCSPCSAQHNETDGLVIQMMVAIVSQLYTVLNILRKVVFLAGFSM